MINKKTINANLIFVFFVLSFQLVWNLSDPESFGKRSWTQKIEKIELITDSTPRNLESSNPFF